MARREPLFGSGSLISAKPHEAGRSIFLSGYLCVRVCVRGTPSLSRNWISVFACTLHFISYNRTTLLFACSPLSPIINKSPVKCFSSFLCFFHWLSTVRVGKLGSGKLYIWTDGTSVTSRSGYAWVEHAYGSSCTRAVEGVNPR